MARTVRPRIFGNVGVVFGVVLSALAGVASCGGTDESLVSPCKSQLACGQACDVTNACAQGQYCGTDSKCTAQCVSGDTRCGDGKRCDPNGRCVDGLQLTGGTNGTGATT